MNQSYWIVVGTQAANPPYMHSTRYTAEQEATRLARLHPSTTFTVFRSEASFVKVDVVRTEMVEGPPF